MSYTVSIIMGSASDYPVMEGAEQILSQFGVQYEKKVISAHRTLDAMVEYVKGARDRGVGVIIAGAGGAAHLAGVAAGLTSLPVIGVPIMTKALGGMDSLLSMVQMPSGVPVATVAINGAKNAALLAVEMLALGDGTLRTEIEKFRSDQAQKVLSTTI